jgi:hypothetical protein
MATNGCAKPAVIGDNVPYLFSVRNMFFLAPGCCPYLTPSVLSRIWQCPKSVIPNCCEPVVLRAERGFRVTVVPAGCAPAEARAMPINRLLDASKLKPEEIDRLNRAFTFALRSLSLVDRNDPLTEMVAKKIIEIGATIADPAELANAALRKLGIP